MMEFTRETADAQLKQLVDEGRWEEALAVCRRMAQELHSQCRRLLWRLLPRAQNSPLHAAGHASARQ